MRRFEKLLDLTIDNVCVKYDAQSQKKYDDIHHEIYYHIHVKNTEDTLKVINDIESSKIGGLADAFPDDATNVTCYYAWRITDDVTFNKEIVCVNSALKEGIVLGDGDDKSDREEFTK